MNLGRAIKLCRIQRELTQVELAKRASLSVSYLSLIEKNKRNPSISTVTTIASALRVPLNVLIFLASDASERTSLGEEVSEKLSRAILELLHEPETESRLL